MIQYLLSLIRVRKMRMSHYIRMNKRNVLDGTGKRVEGDGEGPSKEEGKGGGKEEEGGG